MTYTKGTTPAKLKARQDTIVKAIKRSGLKDFDYLSLSSRQTLHDTSEISDLEKRGLITKDNYIGVDTSAKLVNENRKDRPGWRFKEGKVEDVIRHIDRTGDRPLVAFLDYCTCSDVFFPNNGLAVNEAADLDETIRTAAWREQDYVGNWATNKNGQRRSVQMFSGLQGSLSKTLSWMEQGDMVVVNVMVEGRGNYLTRSVEDTWIPATLARHKGWTLAPWMAGGQKFYDYKSGPFIFRSFCLYYGTPRVKATDAIRERIYKLITEGAADAIIRTEMLTLGLNPKSLGAYKAQVTMGRNA